MIACEKNYVSVNQIEHAGFKKNLAGNIYGSYQNGRNVCGIVVAISGKATYTFKDGSVKELHAGEAALLSDKLSYIVTSEKDTPFVHYTINFSLTPGFSFPSNIMIKPVNFSSFVKNCELLIKYYYSGTPTSRLRCTAVLYELIADMMEQNLSDSIGSKAYYSVMPAINYIDQNFNTEISIDLLARLCTMSETNFRRVFTTVCGTSPIHYLLDVRIKRAKERLEHSNYTVVEIALLCGFKDVEHFCRSFKKRTGMSASKYRIQLQNSDITRNEE